MMTRLLYGLPVKLMLAAALAIALGGCGTNIRGLLAKEAARTWPDENLIREAEGRAGDDDVANALAGVRTAEETKYENCEEINSAVLERLDSGELPFFDQFVGDLKLLIALLFPIGRVERCADAHDDYADAVDGLRYEVEGGGGGQGG